MEQHITHYYLTFFLFSLLLKVDSSKSSIIALNHRELNSENDDKVTVPFQSAKLRSYVYLSEQVRKEYSNAEVEGYFLTFSAGFLHLHYVDDTDRRITNLPRRFSRTASYHSKCRGG
jgi:hypothetical protein